MYVRYGQLPAPGVARKCGVIAVGVGVNRLVCVFVSREKILDEYCDGAYHVSPSSWRPGGAAAKAKPRDTLSVCLCFMGVSDCVRLRPFRLSGPCGGVCKATWESQRQPVTHVVPSMYTVA